MTVLRAPFPWFGGKSRASGLIWARFGNVPNYVEPFAGSLAVLLARPHGGGTETVNDLDCYLANFWRAVATGRNQTDVGVTTRAASASGFRRTASAQRKRHRYLAVPHESEPTARVELETALLWATWC